jgi:hypothetical protein
MIFFPNVLIQAFIQLDDPCPENIATAFYQALVMHDDNANTPTEPSDLQDSEPSDLQDSETDTDEEHDVIDGDKDKTPVTSSKSTKDPKPTVPPTTLSLFEHILQFCYLCIKEKIPPLHFTIALDTETKTWFNNIENSIITTFPTSIQNSFCKTSTMDDDETTDSMRSMCKAKDTHIEHTLLKISETLDQNNLRANAETEKKDPGFKKLEPHRQLLILNALATYPFDQAADSPTAFYIEFLAQKQQFKANNFYATTWLKTKFYSNHQQHLRRIYTVWTGYGQIQTNHKESATFSAQTRRQKKNSMKILFSTKKDLHSLGKSRNQIYQN